MDPSPIGVFDSGVGGLSILREINRLLPDETTVYFADQAHLPYGERSLADVRLYAHGITRFLLDQGCKIIVVACNSASAAALHDLRQTYPQVLFVGMEPAVKPAVQATRTGVIGVLATPVTFQGELFESVVARFAANVRVLQETPLGLVRQIESGELDSEATRNILARSLEPFQAEGADTIVLGCTHYPFIIPQLQRIAGTDITIIDPAPAISRQVERLLDEHQRRKPGGGPGKRIFYTSAHPDALAEQVLRLLQLEGDFYGACWRDDRLETR